MAGFSYLSRRVLDYIESDERFARSSSLGTVGERSPVARISPRRILAARRHPARKDDSRIPLAERKRTLEDLGMTPLAEFYGGQHVFITGHTGFKAGWLTTWLKMMGAHVTGFALPAHDPPSFFDAVHVAHGIDSLLGDIRDFETLRSALNDFQPSIVFHMAAQPLVRHSYEDPVATYATNVMGTVHLLEAVRQVDSVRAVVVVTSDKCYQNREWVWGYRENEPLGGFDPYSSSKGCAELVTAAYRQSFFSQGRTAWLLPAQETSLAEEIGRPTAWYPTSFELC